MKKLNIWLTEIDNFNSLVKENLNFQNQFIFQKNKKWYFQKSRSKKAEEIKILTFSYSFNKELVQVILWIIHISIDAVKKRDRENFTGIEKEIGIIDGMINSYVYKCYHSR